MIAALFDLSDHPKATFDPLPRGVGEGGKRNSGAQSQSLENKKAWCLISKHAAHVALFAFIEIFLFATPALRPQIQ
jgi:hypothetical protein